MTDVDPAVRDILVLFYRCQPGPTWTEFMSWAPAMQDVAAEINDQMEYERIGAEAAAFSIAARSPEATVDLLGDEKLRRDVAEDAAARRIHARMAAR